MNKSDAIRLRHMLDATREAISFIQNRTRNDLDADRMLVLSLVKSLEIIGEAATKVTKETKEKFRQIPWDAIVSMRNRLIHGYFDIDLDIVWKTTTQDLPSLLGELEKIIPLKEKSMK
jgi:uncharacterized protein with HEPN domain